MKTGFYPRLAFDGIRKNRRMYLPYILTCTGMVMMHYIMVYIQTSETFPAFPGAEMARSMVGWGGWVVAVFSGIFLFYTNAFLMRRRKKEFGLYNILGMGKRNIGLVLFWETLMISAFSLAGGLAAGIAFSKLAELGLVNIVQGEVTYALSVSWKAVGETATVFGVIFALLFFNALRQVRSSSALSLIRSENVGEKPPRGNWLVGLLGVAFLAAAYYLALSIKDPIAALTVFFGAVILVILGTYLVMTAGSVLFCRLLQRRKRYYYQANHFISVSSMVYRMKRNGAGLASICILATMVLVMISSTSTLYAGCEDTLNRRYPRDINMDFRFVQAGDLSDDNIAALRKEILTVAARDDVALKNRNDYRSASVAGYIDGNTVETDITKVNDFHLDTYTDVYQFFLVPLADYNAAMGTAETLGEQEALLYTYRAEYTGETLSFNGGATFHIQKQVDNGFDSGAIAMNVLPSMVLIVPDMEAAVEGLASLTDYSGNPMLQFYWSFGFDTDAAKEEQVALTGELETVFRSFENREERPYWSCYVESREAERNSYYGLFGGLFYLGIILSVVFVFATVLIIYYKQVSEGYEDQSRFEIMQKVGMTKKEIRRSINSQLLTVFFLPLLGAGLHLAFAFPMIRKLLLLFNLNNVPLFAGITAICFLVFALFYTIVYRITSNAYYKIVSGAKNA